MKHKFDDSVDVNLNVDIPIEDLEALIEKVTDSVIIIIGVSTAAHILKKWVK